MAQRDKTFTIYTSTADVRKSLKQATQVVLTVTPRKQSDLFVSQTPLAWKVLDYTSESDTQHIVTWHADPAFSVKTHGGEVSTYIPLGSSAILEDGGADINWNTVPGKRGVVMARNETQASQVIALGSIDHDDCYEGFVQFVTTPPGGAVATAPAVMLQAYAVKGYTPGKPLSQLDQKSYLIRKYDGSPSPIDLTTLANDSPLHLRQSNPDEY